MGSSGSSSVRQVWYFKGMPVRGVVENGVAYLSVLDLATILGYTTPKNVVYRFGEGGIRRRLMTDRGLQLMLLISQGKARKWAGRSEQAAAPAVYQWLSDEEWHSVGRISDEK